MATTGGSVVAVWSCAGNDAAISRTTISNCRQIQAQHAFGYRSRSWYVDANTRIQKYILPGGRLASAAALRLTRERFPRRRNRLARLGFDLGLDEVFEGMWESHRRGSR